MSHGSNLNFNDSHHTTVTLTPTYGNGDVICGHGTVTTHPFDHGALSGMSVHADVDGCISSSGGEWHATGPHGGGMPSVGVGIGFDW